MKILHCLERILIIGIEHAAKLHNNFCLNANPLFFETIYADFIPDKDYDCRCFKKLMSTIWTILQKNINKVHIQILYVF